MAVIGSGSSHGVWPYSSKHRRKQLSY